MSYGKCVDGYVPNTISLYKLTNVKYNLTMRPWIQFKEFNLQIITCKNKGLFKETLQTINPFKTKKLNENEYSLLCICLKSTFLIGKTSIDSIIKGYYKKVFIFIQIFLRLKDIYIMHIRHRDEINIFD